MIAQRLNDQTREHWLKQAVALLGVRFALSGYVVPPVHVSAGFPSRSSLATNRRRIGECWSSTVSEDGQCHLFVSPVLSETVPVAATLAHELVHATVGLEAKHGPVFRKCALAIGLTGKMTATVASEAFEHWILGTLTAQIGNYPQPKFDPAMMTRSKDTTRLIKCACPTCGYTVRVTRKWIETGTPLCPCNGESMEAA